MLRRALEIRVDSGKLRAVVFKVVILVEVAHQQLIVFVYEYHHAPTGHLMGSLNDICESRGKILRLYPYLELFFPFQE